MQKYFYNTEPSCMENWHILLKHSQQDLPVMSCFPRFSLPKPYRGDKKAGWTQRSSHLSCAVTDGPAVSPAQP